MIRVNAKIQNKPRAVQVQKAPMTMEPSVGPETSDDEWTTITTPTRENEKMNRIRLRCVTTLFVTVWALLAGVANAQTVSPTTLELLLPDGATTIEPVSLTFDFACFAPIEVDVIASDTLPLVENLDGALVNNCSGDTSTFDMQFTGDGMDHDFELQFVDLANGRMLGTIPVTLSVPEPSSFVLLGFVAMILSRARRNRMRSRWPKA